MPSDKLPRTIVAFRVVAIPPDGVEVSLVKGGGGWPADHRRAQAVAPITPRDCRGGSSAPSALRGLAVGRRMTGDRTSCSLIGRCSSPVSGRPVRHAQAPMRRRADRTSVRRPLPAHLLHSHLPRLGSSRAISSHIRQLATATSGSYVREIPRRMKGFTGRQSSYAAVSMYLISKATTLSDPCTGSQRAPTGWETWALFLDPNRPRHFVQRVSRQAIWDHMRSRNPRAR
jgi:hypothetical protein